MLNKTLLIGNLTKDPELRYSTKGNAVVNLRIASSQTYTPKDGGEPTEQKLYINAVAWGKRAENCNEHLKKGSHVFIEGRLLTREWKDSNDEKHSVIELYVEVIQFLDRAKEGTSPEEPWD